MKTEIELLRSICEIQTLNIMNHREVWTYPKFREHDDFDLNRQRVCLWHTNLWTSSKRKYVALKLEKLGVIEIIKNGAYSPICIRFKNKEYLKEVFKNCQESLAGFSFVSGNGLNSYPQYTRTENGKSEVLRISELFFNKIIKDLKLN